MICKWFDLCPLRKLEKQKIIDDKWKNNYCLTETRWKTCKRYQLEEKGIIHPDNLLPNNKEVEFK